MNEQEKEINLKRLFYKALKNWRVAAVAAIIAAVVIGGTKCAVEMVKISDPEERAERETEYQGELALYQQEGEIIRKTIESLEDSIVQQNDYNENSVLMRIDPYNEWWGSIDFYVETDWKIMPDLSYQNQNPANQIVRVYNTYISNGELYQYVIGRLDTPMEIRYLREVLSGSADASNFLIHFTVRGTTQEECQKLLSYIEEGMRAKLPEIVSSVGEFRLLTTNNSTYSQINYDLEQSQKHNLQVITDMKTSLSAKKFEQLEWERDEIKIKEPLISTGDAIKEGIKWAILASMISVLCIFFFFGVRYVLSRFVQDREAFVEWGVFVAEIPRVYKKRCFRGIDRVIAKSFLGDVHVKEYATRLQTATKHMGETAKLTYKSTSVRLALVGDVQIEEMERLAESMKLDGVHFIVAGNPLLDIDAIGKITESEGVVLVAKQEYTQKDNLQRFREQINELKKTIDAVILLDADALM